MPTNPNDIIYAPGYLPRNLKFPDYPGDVEDENEDLDMCEEDCSQGVKLLEYLRAERLKDPKDKDSEDKDKESDYNEPEDTESEDNESEGEGHHVLFDPTAGNPLDRFLHVKDPVIEVEEWHGCPICGDLNKSHVVICCPWLKKIPKDQRPGPLYDIYCIDCGMLGRDCHSSGVAAVLKSCGLCWLSGHWAKSCPYYKPKNP